MNHNQTSWRHHYIPQFYLNGFTSNGKFKIYDVQEKTFIKNGIDFSPRSYFFEKDSNTLFNDEGEGTDFIEDVYKELDGKVAEVFNRINNASSENQYNINDNDIALLQYFIGLMYWRVPSNFHKIEKMVSEKELKSLGLILRNDKGEQVFDAEIESKIKNNPSFCNPMKFLIASISYTELFKCKTPLHISPFPKGFPFICSDNPIICRNPDTFRVYSDDFIFPLNSTLIFTRGQKIIDYRSTLKVEIDLLTYKQAKKYVSYTDIRYIQMLDSLFENSYKNLDDLRFSIFRQLLGYKV